MHVSLSIIKADIASIGGHISPSQCLVQMVREFITDHGAKLLLDSYVSYTGDDIAYEAARRTGQYRELPDEWFVTDISECRQQGFRPTP